MCVGLKARVADIENGMAVVDASGVKRTISAELIDDLAPGDYVMVHAGIDLMPQSRQGLLQTSSDG